MRKGSLAGLSFDRETVRRIWHGWMQDPAGFEIVGEADPELLALVADPFETVDEVADRLERLEFRLLTREDRRSVFLTVYTEMTAHTVRAVGNGEFSDPEWMGRYLVRFAEYYRRAFLAFEQNAFEEVPDPWLVAFGTATRGDTLVVQDAFLGINAHIVYDLALTLSDIGLDPNRDDKYADHRRIDGILAALVSVQRELLAERYAPGLERVGESMGGLDERWSASTLAGARETAWQTAAIRSGARFRFVEAYTDWLLSRTATGGASLLLSPTISPSTMRALHAIEADQFDLTTYTRAFHERATHINTLKEETFSS